ncbi:hypothetical protein C4569_00120 [Candidatus Parcubacteria bacterium]|nr:MAG: hypothetical protein C4569_00120 [Candidatus Parcubacteria bacterium]
MKNTIAVIFITVIYFVTILYLPVKGQEIINVKKAKTIESIRFVLALRDKAKMVSEEETIMIDSKSEQLKKFDAVLNDGKETVMVCDPEGSDRITVNRLFLKQTRQRLEADIVQRTNLKIRADYIVSVCDEKLKCLFADLSR